jgi:hypothetical protein
VIQTSAIRRNPFKTWLLETSKINICPPHRPAGRRLRRPQARNLPLYSQHALQLAGSIGYCGFGGPNSQPAMQGEPLAHEQAW